MVANPDEKLGLITLPSKIEDSEEQVATIVSKLEQPEIISVTITE